MEGNQTPGSGDNPGPRPRDFFPWALYLLGATATLNVLAVTLKRWNAHDFLSVLGGGMLCVYLVLIPAIGIWREKKGKHKVTREEIIFAGYMSLMLVITALTR